MVPQYVTRYSIWVMLLLILVGLQFRFSPMTKVIESSKITLPTKPAKNQPPIRFPSRLLDRIKANKRKRWTSPKTIPNLKRKSYELGEAKFYGNVEDNDKDEISGQKPGKIRRTSQLQNFSSQRATKTNLSWPCTGNQPIIPKTPILVTNAAGRFKVPSPGNCNRISSKSKHEVASNTTTINYTITNTSTNKITDDSNLRPASQPPFRKFNFNFPLIKRPMFTALEDWLQTASSSVAIALEQIEVDPDMAGAVFRRGLNNTSS